MYISRLAPTPSGYLHLGNIYSFALTWAMVKKSKGTLWLRIDDCDGTRVREEYIKDIFTTLKWLGFDWDEGPQDYEEFQNSFSQVAHADFYREKLEQLSTFHCYCSRKEIKERVGSLTYDGYCKNQQNNDAKNSSIRYSGGVYPVIWTKGDLPAYQLASVCDDIRSGINLIVRGEDLRETTEIQKELFLAFGRKLPEVHFHSLIYGESEGKLSKSNHDQSIKYMREQGVTPEQVFKALGDKVRLPINSLKSFLN